MNGHKKFRSDDLNILFRLDKILLLAKQPEVEEEQSGENAENDLVSLVNILCAEFPDNFIVFSIQGVLSSVREVNEEDFESDEEIKSAKNGKLLSGLWRVFFHLLFQELKKFYHQSIQQEEEQSYCCPIYQTLLVNPVVLNSTGQTYEQKALHEWFVVHMKKTCPLTAQILSDISYSPNSHLKSNVDAYKTKFANQSKFLLGIIFRYFQPIVEAKFFTKDRVLLLEKVFQKVLVFKKGSSAGMEFLEKYVVFLEYRQKNDLVDVIDQQIDTKKNDIKTIQRDLNNFFLREKKFDKSMELLKSMLSAENKRKDEKERILLDLIRCCNELKKEDELNAFILELTMFYRSEVSQEKAMVFLQGQTELSPGNNVLLKALAEYHSNPRYVSSVYYQIGLNFLEKKDLNNAVTNFKTSIEQNKMNKKSHVELKKLYLEMKKPKEAMEICLKLIDLASTYQDKEEEMRDGLKIDDKNLPLRRKWLTIALKERKFETVLEITAEPKNEENELGRLRNEALIQIFQLQQTEIELLRMKLEKQKKKRIEQDRGLIELRAELEAAGVLGRKKKKRKKGFLIAKDETSRSRLDEKIVINTRNNIHVLQHLPSQTTQTGNTTTKKSFNELLRGDIGADVGMVMSPLIVDDDDDVFGIAGIGDDPLDFDLISFDDDFIDEEVDI